MRRTILMLTVALAACSQERVVLIEGTVRYPDGSPAGGLSVEFLVSVPNRYPVTNTCIRQNDCRFSHEELIGGTTVRPDGSFAFAAFIEDHKCDFSGGARVIGYSATWGLSSMCERERHVNFIVGFNPTGVPG